MKTAQVTAHKAQRTGNMSRTNGDGLPTLPQIYIVSLFKEIASSARNDEQSFSGFGWFRVKSYDPINS